MQKHHQNILHHSPCLQRAWGKRNHRSLPLQLELALHDREDACAAELCNSAPAAFDPYADPCSAEASGARRSQELFSVVMSALCLALCSKMLQAF